MITKFTVNIQIADTVNTCFETTINSLEINKNRFILTKTASFTDPVKNQIKKCEYHPRIITIKEKDIIKTPFKVGLSPSKKNCFICFNESPLKMMKNAFYFINKKDNQKLKHGGK